MTRTADTVWKLDFSVVLLLALSLMVLLFLVLAAGTSLFNQFVLGGR